MPLNLEPVQSGYNLSVINENFQRIEDTWDEKLDRLVSTQSNQMEQELDMNSNHIINNPTPTEPLHLVRLKDLNDLVFGGNLVGAIPFIQPRQVADGVNTVFAAPNDKVVGEGSMFVNIDGVTQRPVTDFSVSGVNEITFSEAPPLNSQIDITYFEPKILEEGATGSFTSNDGKTITVIGGLITEIV